MSKDLQRRPAAKKDAAAIGDRTRKSDRPVMVVGIGASAGELKSLKQLFAGMPPGHGVAFVLIQHLEPPQENLTVKLLQGQTALAVVEATDGMPVLVDRIHIMPPNKFLNIAECRLTLHEPVYCSGLRMPIDHFFCSLATDQRRRACGILFSGTGSDGILGLSEVKAAGGRTIGEDPGSAEFRNLPPSEIEAGMVDAVLPAGAMGQAMVAMAEQVIADTRSDPAESPEFDANLRAALDILRAKVGHDFRCYKPNTLVRRIRRRMTLGKVATFADYARFLREHPEEVGLLQKDLLIGVTEFFRQPQAWEVLEEKVIAALVENAQPGSGIRVWVPGCSTGKEAYSLAMLLAEQVEKSGKKVAVQIFATDSDAAALATARSGSYSKEEIAGNVSPERLKRFFARKDGRYQVIKKVREQVVFAPQNLTADPPFSRLDLISCRNLLIYLDQRVQKKIIVLFHFALREGGFLFLGNAETVGDREDLFEPVSKKWRVYRRIGAGRPADVEIPVRPSGGPQSAAGKLPVAASWGEPGRVSAPRLGLASTAQQALLDRFAPACVMIDRKLQVLYVHGTVEDYLTFPAGELTTRVVDMAREGLRARLRGAIGKCIEIGRSVSVTARVRRGEKSVPVKATVTPLRYPREADGLLLITFEDYRVSAAKLQRRAAGKTEVHQLEDELKVTREELQSTIEQLESSNDQLKASNEEVTAANEELQSANEEMETSKEELQSLNEELNTINARLHEKVEELESINNDVVNLLSSTNIATVFLDKDLKVRRYTPASTNLFSLIPSDAGRPIADVLRRFTDEALMDDARRVLADLTPLSQEVPAEDGRWYIRRITPYRTQDDRIEGVVVTFVDVCDLKQTEEALRLRQAELEAARAEAENGKRRLAVIVDSIADGFFAFDREWRITHVNDAALLHYRKTREEMVGRVLFEVFPTARGSVFETEYRRAMTSGEPVHFEAPSTFSDRIMEIHAYPGPDIMTVLFRDVTERHRMAAALREAHERAAWLARFPEENPNPVARVSAEGKVLYCNPASAENEAWGCKVGCSLPEAVLPLFGQAMTEGKEAEQDVDLGGRFYSVSVTPFPAERYANVYGRDVTERKRAEEELKEATRLVQQRAAELDAILETMTEPLLFYDAQGRLRRINAAAAVLLGIDPDVSNLDERAIMDIWKSKKYRDLGGRPMSLEEMPFRRALNGETVRGQMLCLTTADGREAIVEVNAAVLESNGRPDGVVVVWRDVTERKRAEQEVLRAKQEWERTFDAVPDLIAILDDRHRILRANRAMAQRLGLTPDQCVGKLCHQAVHGLDFPPDFCPHALALADGKEHVAEMHEDFLGGDFLVSTTPLADEQGRHIGSVHVARDITGRKRVEEALRESQKDLNRAQAVAHTGSWRLDVRRNELLWSDETHRIFGIPQGVPLNYEAFLAAIHPEDREGVDRKWGAAQRGETYDIEHRIVVDGTVKWVRERAELEFDKEGLLLGGFGTVQDITERKKAEEALRQNEARFKLLSETAGRLLATDNPRGIVNELCRDVMAHLDCQAFFNFLVDEAVGQLHLNACAGIPEEEVRKIEWLDYGVAVCGCAARDKTRIVAENIRTTPDPRTDLVKSYGIQAYACHPLMVQDRLIGTLSFGTKTRTSFSPEDLALMKTVADEVARAMDRMRLIEELKRSRDELEERVRERTEELAKANEALRRLSSRLLWAQEDERKRIAGDLHDTIGACLSAIKFKVESTVQQMGKNPIAATESLNIIIPVIQEGVEECRRIQMDLRPSMLDDLGLLPTLSWFCRRFRTIYSEIQVEPEIEIEEGDVSPPLRVVAFRVTQEAMNNVAKHSHANRVHLSLQKLDDRIQLVIRDNGQGFNVEKTHDQKTEKRGLGLLSMRERVELSGGSFAIESTEGIGTTVTASWPLRGNG